jgi:hypothetical protein
MKRDKDWWRNWDWKPMVPLSQRYPWIPRISGPPLTPEQREQVDRLRAEATAIIREELAKDAAKRIAIDNATAEQVPPAKDNSR